MYIFVGLPSFRLHGHDFNLPKIVKIWALFFESRGNLTDTKQYWDLRLRSGSVLYDAKKAGHSVLFQELCVHVHVCLGGEVTAVYLNIIYGKYSFLSLFQFWNIYLQHRPNTGERESHVKYSASRNDSGEDKIHNDPLFYVTFSVVHVVDDK